MGVGVGARVVLGPSLGSETGKHTEDFRVSVPAKQNSSLTRLAQVTR